MSKIVIFVCALLLCACVRQQNAEQVAPKAEVALSDPQAAPHTKAMFEAIQRNPNVRTYEVNLSGIEIDEMPPADTAALRANFASGTVNVVFWRPMNLITGDSADDVSMPGVVEAVTYGGVKNEMFREWLGVVADWFVAMPDVPFVFSPYDNMDSDGYWWGATQCAPEQYRNMWAELREVFADRGVHNVAFCVAAAPVTDGIEFTRRFPGFHIADLKRLGGEFAVE